MGKIKGLYNSNKKAYNIVAILLLACLMVWYFSIFFQKGIYFREIFYKERIEGDSYVYKSSEDDYFTVNKSDDMYTFEIKTLEDYGTIKIKEADEIYYLYYPDNEVYKGEYKNGYFFNEDGSAEFNDHFPNLNVQNKSFAEKYPKGFIIRTTLRENIEVRGRGEVLFVGIIAFIMGVLKIKYPKSMGFSGDSWKFKNYEEVELSEEYISYNKVISIIVLIGSFIAFIVAINII